MVNVALVIGERVLNDVQNTHNYKTAYSKQDKLPLMS